MANPEHLQEILKGAESWNAWRKANPYLEYDLSKADLQHLDLSGVDFSDAILEDAVLYQTKFEGAKFYLAKMKNADLGGCNLISVNMINADLTNACLDEALLLRANMDKCTLAQASLVKAKMKNAKLNGAFMEGCNLSEADLTCADLTDAMIDISDLSNANLSGAMLTKASLSGSLLTGANLQNANLDNANLYNADLTGADLTNADMVDTDFTKATVTGCKIYGISAWNVNMDEAVQKDLIISKGDEPVITVDDIAVAQFIYLIINNKNLRNVLNTITSKGVLILGRFSEPARKAVLDGLRDKLRHFDLLPMVFDFDRPTDKDYTETVQTLAGMSMFVIADLTSPKSTPLELEATVKQFKIPYVPIIDVSVDKRAFAMLVDLQKSFHWVLPTLQYETMEDLLDDDNLKTYIIEPVNKKREELRQSKQTEPEPILMKKKSTTPVTS